GALGGLPGGAAVGEGRAGDRVDHGAPRLVAVHDRVGGRDPVDDLALAGRGLLQRGVGEVDAGVEDADGDAAAVRLGVLLHEVHGAGLEGRVVRVLRGGLLVRGRV